MKTREEVVAEAIRQREERVRARYARQIEQFEADVQADITSVRPNGYVVVEVDQLSMSTAYRDRTSHDFLWLLSNNGYRLHFMGMDPRNRTVRVLVSW